MASVTISPNCVSLTKDEKVKLTAVPKDAQGNSLSGRKTVWDTSKKEIATVAADGVVQAISEGYATISATVEGQSGTASIAVIPPDGRSSILRVTFDRLLDFATVEASDFLFKGAIPHSTGMGGTPNEVMLTVGVYSYPPLPGVEDLRVVGKITDRQGLPASVICVHPL